jgi:hypothetical protein
MPVTAGNEMQAVCKYAGESVLYFHVCNQCSAFLEVCTPRIGVDGWLIGAECDISACEGCDSMECIYLPTYQARYRTAGD